jgi:hypothetical protein
VTAPIWPVAKLRVYGAIAWFVAAGFGVWGTFAPLYEQRVGRRDFVFTAWGSEGTEAGSSDSQPEFGIPIVIAAVLLVIATSLAISSTRAHPATAPVLAARLIGVGGAGALAASTAMLLVLLDAFFGSQSVGPNVNGGYGLGTWLLVGSSVLAIAAVVLMLIPRVKERVEPETPPMGIPVVRVLEPEYDEPEFKADLFRSDEREPDEFDHTPFQPEKPQAEQPKQD